MNAPITDRHATEIAHDDPAARDLAALVAAGEPVVIRGLVADWPLVAAGRTGARAAADHILGFYNGRPVTGYTGRPELGGRYGYDASLTRLDFEAERVPLGGYLDRILAAAGQAAPESYYIGSTDLDLFFPGFNAANPPVLPAHVGDRALSSIWIGNRTIASAHHDMANNIACVAAGRRRFTLFPPDQIANLYPGPLEPTPGGQVVSLVDFADPDPVRFPDFAIAARAARIAELNPGDAVVYPALWWHQVEALEDFNILVNYWWNDAPRHADTPMNTLLHGMLSLRDRPPAEKDAWRAMFDYYVFGAAERPVAHLPPAAHGPLGRLDETGARRLRAELLRRLNR